MHYIAVSCGSRDTGLMTTDTGVAARIAAAGLRALAEAEARRAEQSKSTSARAKEIGGRKGLDPVRYGDWEIKGIACDF